MLNFIGLLLAIGFQSTTVDSLNNASYQLRKKNPELSLELSREALKQAQSDSYDSGKSVAYYNMSLAYYYNDMIDSAIRVVNNGIQFDSTNQFYLLIPTKLNARGVYLKKSGDLEGSLLSYELSLSLSVENKDTLTIVKCLNNIGNIYKNQGFYDLAFQSLMKSLRLKEMIGDEMGAARTKNNLANILTLASRYDESFSLYKENIEFFKSNQDTALLAQALYNLSSSQFLQSRKDKDLITEETKEYFNNGSLMILKRTEQTEFDLDTAESYVRYARQLYELIQNKRGVSNCLTMLSSIHENRGEIDEAIELLKIAENNYLDLQDEYNLSYVYFNLGTNFIKKRQLKTAKKYFEKCYNLANGFGNTSLLMDTYLQLSMLSQVDQDYASALDFLNTYEILHYQSFNEEKSRQIAELQTKYETEKKDKELLLRQAKIDLTAAERDTLMYTLAMLVTLAVFIIIFFNQRQKAMKKLREKDFELHEKRVSTLIRDQELKSINSMLEGEEKERKRIAEDLHDRVGSMLSALKLQMDPHQAKLLSLLDETAEEVRRISHNLETKVLNRFGLMAALDDLGDKINESGRVHLEMHFLDLDERLDNKIEINAYRIVQELLSNVLKHSQANEITTQVNRVEQQLIILVEDNGKGFDTRTINDKSGMGLKNIKSRVNELNGSLNLDSTIGRGTAVTVEIPL